VEGGDARRPADPVHGEPGIALEVDESCGGAVAEDAVDPARVEAERAQPALKGGDVIAPQHGRAPVEEALAQAVTGLDQRGPGLGPAHAVGAQAPMALEGTHR